jgi:hypothetical protein
MIPARACGCSFCVKHGGVWTSCPTGTLRIRIKDETAVAKYAFGTRTADFLVCRDCGVAPVVTSRIAERLYAVVNVNALEDIDPSLYERGSTSFDAETGTERLARRQRHWIADVAFEE